MRQPPEAFAALSLADLRAIRTILRRALDGSADTQ
jgi:hypothetical protein